MIREYQTIREITGSLLRLSQVEEACWGEAVEVLLPDGGVRRGRVTALAGGEVTVQLFDGGEGLEPGRSRVRLLGHPVRLGLSEDMLGRVFDGLGEPRDGGAAVLPELCRDIVGKAEEASLRALAETPVQTGLPAMDDEAPLLLGQCRALFAAPETGGKALQTLLRDAKAAEETPFTLVLACLGLAPAEQETILQTLDHCGAAERAVVFANAADEPAERCLVTAELAMTAAEYFAFEKERPVLLLMLDMTAWAEARRALAATRGEALSALETDLGALFERAGLRMGKKGSVSLLAMHWQRGGEEQPVAGVLRAAAEGWLLLEEKTEAPAENALEEENKAPEEAEESAEE